MPPETLKLADFSTVRGLPGPGRYTRALGVFMDELAGLPVVQNANKALEAAIRTKSADIDAILAGKPGTKSSGPISGEVDFTKIG